jgi:hypothetical protein
MVMEGKRGAYCNCGICGEKLHKGDVGYRFTVKGSSKWFTKACYESMKFAETDNTSDYDAVHTIDHEMKIVCDDKNEAIIKMLQGFHVTKGFGKNAGKFYCTLSNNKACYCTGHFVNGGEVRVNGKTVKNLKEFREATH